MNIGYCIMAHENNNILRTTINILSKTEKVYLHIDDKSNIEDFKEYNGKVKFTDKRVDVRWGEFSQVTAMLALYEEAFKDDNDYICLISGYDLPLKNPNDIKEFFEKNNGKEFIEIIEMDQNQYDAVEKRVRNKYKLPNYKKDSKTGKYVPKRNYKTPVNIGENEYFEKLPRLQYGGQWMSISKGFYDYITKYLEENSWYIEAFRYAFCADESFFQTIIMDSPFKEKIHKIDEIKNNKDCYMSLKYIVWIKGKPKELNENDFNDIKKSKYKDCIFGRKFSVNLDIEKYKKAFGINI